MHHLIIAMHFIFFSGISCNKAVTPEKEEIKTEIVSTTIADLRKSNVRGNVIYRTTDNGGGDWTYDAMDATSEDNTGTVLLTESGQRVKRISQGPLNVKWFGAKGDSISDETDAFNKALAAAKSQKQSLYIPAGIYSCNKADKDNHILVLDAGSLDNITISGDGVKSKITTSSKASTLLLYIYAYSKNHNLKIRDLAFESVHPVMTNYSHGIMLQGTKGENFVNTEITGCGFEGFSTTIIGQGLNGIEISNNQFNAPLGHDNAQNNSSPAVYIWFFDDNNGFCSDIKIINNLANGYSGSEPIGTLSSKRPMDGFIYGTGYGYLVSGNKTKYFSEEHIVIAPQTTDRATTRKIVISNNELDGSIPTGAKNQNGSMHSSNYAIRCDASHSSITDNSINNFTIGIMVRTFDYPAIRGEDINISGNTLVSQINQPNCKVSKGISVQGSVKNRLRKIIIENNKITVANVRTGNNFSGIAVIDTDSADVRNNQIDVSDLISEKKENNFGISYGRVNAILDTGNLIKNITPHNVIVLP
ncbi:MAG: hypothetical protein M3N30_03365, partial [Bacteroidota bacterium]|nr:hypothetical protein [Bacteroidota bacterium]